jgi:mono/diheme cytochrome c family protein
MNEQQKKEYLEHYKVAKEKGVPFFPDIIFKDVIISFVVFILLVSLAYFIGVPTEARADPNDTTYTPRPEWYFLFLFQLLKYFPGKLEVLGAMVVPGLLILLLIILPFIDKSPKRHFLNRPFASVAALLVVGGIATLTVLALREAPPPLAAVPVDQAAALYSQNCANCHGPSIDVPAGTDLHQLIAQGKHEGMPAWGGDLSTDEIDALAGFITSPKGSALYTQYCGECHKNLVEAVGNPQELQRVFEEGPNYAPHQDQSVPNWKEKLTNDERNALLNFLAAPDGQQLFQINCSGCHGVGVAFTGTEEELRDLISKGGQHLTMPAWQRTLSQADLETLAAYVTNPSSNPAGKTLFDQHCSSCHGDKVPTAPDIDTARKIISTGGPHVTMPVWGNILTPEQLDALVQYTLAASKGKGTEEGAQLFATNCVPCHGQFGEGGPNPSRLGDMITSISSPDFLKTRDDATIRNIISQGQPDSGMSPFGSGNGGPLSDDEMDSLVAYIRSWEANPPAISPPEAPTPTPTQPAQAAQTAEQIFKGVCAQCHGANGEGGSGPAINTQEFQSKYDDQALSELISKGIPSTPMIGVGGVFSDEQIKQLVSFIRSLKPGVAEAPTFSGQVLPILQTRCQMCHNSSTHLGGWDGSSYDAVMTSGENGPVVIAGDVQHSLLAQLLQGTNGKIMPPMGALPQEEIQAFLDWIAAGAKNN